MRCLCLLLAITSATALKLAESEPIKLYKDQKTCALTFASHSGFGNQLYGALGAAYIAKITGCKLVLPAVLNHADLHYGSIQSCHEGIKKEKSMVAMAAMPMLKSNLTWNKIFKINTKIASQEPLRADARKLHFLPNHCGLYKQMGEDETKYAQYLKDFIQKTDPTGSYTIGSGYNTGAPRLAFNELFEGLSGNLDQAVSDTQDMIAKLGKKPKGDYACVHLRSKDIYQHMNMQDKPLKNWVNENLNTIGSEPLLVISASLKKNVMNTMADVCSKEETECIDGSSVMPSGTYGFPENGKQGFSANKQLMVELATCAMAKDVYLPNSDKKIINGQEIKAESHGAFKSTMSDLIGTLGLTLAKTPKAAPAVETAKTTSSVRMYVTNMATDKCQCKLGGSPYPVQRVNAVSPSNLKQGCPAKKGIEMADKKAKAVKCTHYNALKLAYEESKKYGNTYSIIMEDTSTIKKGFWQEVDAYLSSPCQTWDYTAVDVTKNGDAIQAARIPSNLKICSWGSKSKQESIYAKVGASTHFQIVRNSAIPSMLQYMDEEEKRDRPMDTIVNHFGNVVAWHPELTVPSKDSKCECE